MKNQKEKDEKILEALRDAGYDFAVLVSEEGSKTLLKNSITKDEYAEVVKNVLNMFTADRVSVEVFSHAFRNFFSREYIEEVVETFSDDPVFVEEFIVCRHIADILMRKHLIDNYEDEKNGWIEGVNRRLENILKNKKDKKDAE